jgi:hypothetical protein
MKAIVFAQTGGPEVLALADASVRRPDCLAIAHRHPIPIVHPSPVRCWDLSTVRGSRASVRRKTRERRRSMMVGRGVRAPFVAPLWNQITERTRPPSTSIVVPVM